MTRRALMFALSLVASVTLAAPVMAGSAQDGNAGLAALNRGAYGEAIRLFTRALKAGDLSPADQEFAYLSRGKAYLGEGKKSLAIADLHKAAQLKPNDPELASILATGSGSAAQEIQTRPSQISQTSQWGPMAPLIGSTWMFVVGGKPTNYLHFEAGQGGTTITYTGLDSAGNPISGSYTLDQSAGTVTEQTSYKGVITTNIVEAMGNGFAEDIQSGDNYSRNVFVPVSTTAFRVEQQQYQSDNTWKTSATFALNQASQSTIDALGWKPAKPPGFWKSLGRSLGAAIVQGAVAGLAAGVQGQPPQ